VRELDLADAEVRDDAVVAHQQFTYEPAPL
jgi:hypothetical protein